MLRILKNRLAVAVMALGSCLIPATASAGVFISVRIGPPVLPVYVQPPCPQPGYMWVPGYWAYGPMGYYWVPGVWVAPPRVGFLWTPGYWGFVGGIYSWHEGYWGPHVGFYGGVNYGFGYAGSGFVGGMWTGGAFRYNTAVTNVNTTVVRNVYVDRTVINNNTTIVNNRASFSGPGGVVAQPTAQERAYEGEQHFQPTSNQVAHAQMASQDRNQFLSNNNGRPAVASMDGVNGHRFNPQAGIAAPHSEVGERQVAQQQRIAQGIGQGQLSPGQARNLEQRQQNINHQVRADRQANGGKLTAQERRQVNREQNRASRQIHEDRQR